MMTEKIYHKCVSYISCPLGQESLLNLDSWGMEDRGLSESHVATQYHSTASATEQDWCLSTSVFACVIF